MQEMGGQGLQQEVFEKSFGCTAQSCIGFRVLGSGFLSNPHFSMKITRDLSPSGFLVTRTQYIGGS